MLQRLKNINETNTAQNSYGNSITLRTSSSLLSYLIPSRINLLKMFFSRTYETQQPAKIVSMKYSKFNKSEQELIERFGGIAFDKQIAIADAIGANSWSLDMINEKINFGDAVEFSFKILGSFSRTTGTWLWAWANTAVEESDESLLHANKLKAYGEENDVDFLKLDSFEASNIDLHLIGLTASGFLKTTGYYIADYGTGAMVFTIQNDEILTKEEIGCEKIETVFNQLINDFDVSQRFALKFYLMEKGYEVTEIGNNLTATHNAKTIFAEFDNENNLTKLNG